MARFTGGGQVGAGSPPTTLVYTRIDSHVAVAPESTYNFTPSSTLLASEFSEIITIIRGSPTAAFAVRINYNDEVGANWDTSGARVVGAVETIFNTPNQTGIEMINSPLVTVAGSFCGEIHFMIQDISSTRVSYYGRSAGFNAGGWFGGFGHTDATKAIDFSELNIFTTASTWLADTRIDTFAVAR